MSDTKLTINFPMIVASIVGLALSVYAFNVEARMEYDKKYSPMCDMTSSMSCSKAFRSEYGRGFGIFPKGSKLNIPNSVFGLIFYNAVFFLVLLAPTICSRILLSLCFLANLSSFYFAYILIYILQDFCIVCVSIYFVNAFLLYQAWQRHKIIIQFNKEKFE